MRIKDCTALVTGANGGLGKNLVAELIARDARRVYAAARDNGTSLDDVVALAPAQIVPLTLDVTDDQQVLAAAQAATDITLLINNAGVMAFGAPLDVDLELVERDLAVNFLGTLRISRAFAPVLEANGGTLVDILTAIALAPIAGMSAYCASKAATRSMTQALRTQLAPKGVSVVGVYPGAMNTSMLADVDIPKTDPAQVARNALDGLEAGSTEITPDDFSTQAYATWLKDPRELEHQFAAWAV